MGRQTALNVGICSHLLTEEVKTNGGETIAIRCATCTVVLAPVGHCDRCGQTRILSEFRRKRGIVIGRFCGRACPEGAA